jgi:hypothetical protein
VLGERWTLLVLRDALYGVPDVADVATTRQYRPAAPRRTDRVAEELAKRGPHRRLTPTDRARAQPSPANAAAIAARPAPWATSSRSSTRAWYGWTKPPLISPRSRRSRSEPIAP